MTNVTKNQEFNKAIKQLQSMINEKQIISLAEKYYNLKVEMSSLTRAVKEKENALPLIRRFYNLGFNIEATAGTAAFLKNHGIKTRVKQKISEGSEEIIESIKKGYVTYVINSVGDNNSAHDGKIIRRAAIDNNVAVFTCLDTVKVLLDVLEEITMGISVIDKE